MKSIVCPLSWPEFGLDILTQIQGRNGRQGHRPDVRFRLVALRVVCGTEVCLMVSYIVFRNRGPIPFGPLAPPGIVP